MSCRKSLPQLSKKQKKQKNKKTKQTKKNPNNTKCTVSSAITLVSLKQIGYYATDQWVNVVYITQTVAYACCLLAIPATGVKTQGWLTSTFILI